MKICVWVLTTPTPCLSSSVLSGISHISMPTLHMPNSYPHHQNPTHKPLHTNISPGKPTPTCKTTPPYPAKPTPTCKATNSTHTHISKTLHTSHSTPTHPPQTLLPPTKPPPTLKPLLLLDYTLIR
jgi:hypothetical protein